jgi:D-tyrosyl-tRNA(Tyr) deacylase
MKAVIQRVKHAKIEIDGEDVSHIERGILALVGVEEKDSPEDAKKLASRLLHFRIFPDENGRMNLSLKDTNGDILLVPQFTLVAETNRGNRPSFSHSAKPNHAATLFDSLVKETSKEYSKVSTGFFGADMNISLVNDGPVTFFLGT